MSGETMVVATLYRSGRIEGNTYDHKMKKEIRKNVKLPRLYVERFNANKDENGKYYEIDEKATKEWLVEHQEQVEEKDVAIEIAAEAQLIARSVIAESSIKRNVLKKKSNK